MSNNIKEVKIGINGIKTVINKEFTPSKSIFEYIWNGLDAKANNIYINLKIQSNLIQQFEIIDDGEGISEKDLDKKFIEFYDSKKKKIKNNKKVHSLPRGERGIGRFSFILFCYEAQWETIYQDKNGKRYKYIIKTDNTKLNKYEFVQEKTETIEPTGTKISFSRFINERPLQNELNEKKDMKNILESIKQEFCWFFNLYENKKIYFNNEELEYKKLMNDESTKVFEINDKKFEIKYIQWKKLNEYSHYYFISSKGIEIFKETTTLNKKSDGFHHSVYVKNDYFDLFSVLVGEVKETPLVGNSKKGDTFKILKEKIDEFLLKKRKPFIRKISKKKIEDFDNDGFLPKFDEKNVLEKQKKTYLKEIIREVYEFQPRVFNLSVDNKKIFIRLLNQLIESGQENSILRIIDEVLDLEKGEKEEFVNLIENVTLKNIIKTSKMIEGRFVVIQYLRHIIFDKKKYTLESEIQDKLEDNYWIFGEEFNLVGAENDKFQKLLTQYNKLHKVESDNVVDTDKKNKEVDLFLCRVKKENGYIHNIVVELKRPSIKLGKKEYDQIEEYSDIISNIDEFNANNEKWSYYLIGNEFDTSNYIKKQYENNKHKGEKDLVFSADNVKIYIKRWSELFNEVDLRLNFIYDKLKLDRDIYTEKVKK